MLIKRTLKRRELRVWMLILLPNVMSGWKNATFKLKFQPFSVNTMMIYPSLVVTSCVISSNRDCQNVLSVAQELAGQSESFRQFEGGVKLGVGSFNLVSPQVFSVCSKHSVSCCGITYCSNDRIRDTNRCTQIQYKVHILTVIV